MARRRAAGRSRSVSLPLAVLALAAAGSLGGIIYNVVAPRGIFRPAPAVVPPPPAPPAAPKPAVHRPKPKPGDGVVKPPVVTPPPGPAEIRIIDLAEARRLLDARGATFVDARSAIGYEFAHIPGALNVPFSDFPAAYAREAARLPKDAPLVVYCTSGSCDEAEITLGHLKAEGYRNLMHFKEGWNAWEIAEYPQEKGPGPR